MTEQTDAPSFEEDIQPSEDDDPQPDASGPLGPNPDDGGDTNDENAV